MKIRKTILFGVVLFGLGMGIATAAFAQKQGPCYPSCMSQWDDAALCGCMCYGACQ